MWSWWRSRLFSRALRDFRGRRCRSLLSIGLFCSRHFQRQSTSIHLRRCRITTADRVSSWKAIRSDFICRSLAHPTRHCKDSRTGKITTWFEQCTVTTDHCRWLRSWKSGRGWGRVCTGRLRDWVKNWYQLQCEEREVFECWKVKQDCWKNATKLWLFKET